MLTAQNIIDNVRAKLTIDSNTISDASFLPIISSVYFETYNTMIETNEDFFGTASSSIAMTAGVSTYALPGFVKLETLEFAYDGTNYYKGQQLERGEISNLNDSADFSSASSPYFDLWGNSATIYPTPVVADVTAGAKLRVWFIPEPTALSAATETLLIPTPYQYVVVDGVEAECWNKMGEETKEDRARRKFQEGLNKLRIFAHGRDASRLFGMSWQDEGYFKE